MRIYFLIILIIVIGFSLSKESLYAQNIYDLRKLTDQDWLEMTSEERLSALNTSNNRARNQTIVGNFGRNYDLYSKWGYDYYEMNDRYENYTFRGFENYNIIEDRRNRWYYNQFGDRLTKMTRSAQIWNEKFNDDGTASVSGPTNFINQRVGFDGIWVARESTDDWAISAVGAGALRAKLTPLTLSYPNLPGMKVDFQSANYQASIINSAIAGKGSYIALGQGGSSGFPTNTLMLRGMQLRRKFGALNIGANYANLYTVQPNRDKGQSLKGTVSNYAPTPMIYAVRIVDDSPQDGDGPIVQDVKLKVDGVYRPDIQPQIIMDDLRREKITAVISKSQMGYYEFNSIYSGETPPFDQTTVNERIPKYLDYAYMNDYVRGWNTKKLTDNFDIERGKQYYKIIEPGGKPIQVNGNEYVVYLFDISSITDRVKRVEAEVTVSNDYRIQVAEIFTKYSAANLDAMGDNYGHYDATFWKTMAQSEGNIKDGSNLRTITVEFGYEVANTIYGFDAHFNYLGFKVDGEFIANSHYYMFSDGVPGTGIPKSSVDDITPRNGHRYSQNDKAYYVIAQKEWKNWGFAGELFKMGKFYRPYFNYYFPFETSGNQYNIRNDYLRISMIEDNDDDDQYPDVTPYPQSMSSRMYSLLDPDGVFPGNDLDNDALPDNEKNDNGLPDYDEPFLMFDVDPDEYVFGDDFNNNTIPDFREDDIKYDTPYELDRKGHHIYLRFTPQRNVNLILGSFRTGGIGLDNRTDDDYVKVNVNYDVQAIGNIYAEYRYEEIKDNIQDSYVVVPTLSREKQGVWGQRTRYDRDLYFDEVEYRNSKVNRLFLESRIRGIPSITIENHVRYERNRQIEGTMYDNTFQPKDILTTFAMVNKFIYTKQWGNFTFSPGVKFRFYKKGRSESINPLDHYLMRIPMVYFKYRISDKTTITYGIQGFKGFELVYNDYIQSRNSYKKVDYILQFENRTNYFGFDTWGGFGYKSEQIMFDEKYRKFEEYKSSSLFLQIWIGY